MVEDDERWNVKDQVIAWMVVEEEDWELRDGGQKVKVAAVNSNQEPHAEFQSAQQPITESAILFVGDNKAQVALAWEIAPVATKNNHWHKA